MSLPQWNDIDARLRALDADVTASGCHGLLCGLLAARAPGARAAYARHSVGSEEPPELLGTLHDETLRQLDTTDFDFELLLPDDEAGLADRVDAMADWCDGFVFGVGAAGRAIADLPADSAEFLGDAMEIARARSDSVSGGEDDEAAYTEVVEYVRVGVLLVRTECAGARATSAAPDS